MGAVSMLEDAVERRDEADYEVACLITNAVRVAQQSDLSGTHIERYLGELKSLLSEPLRSGERLGLDLQTQVNELDTLREILLPVKSLDEKSQESQRRLLDVRNKLHDLSAENKADDFISSSYLSKCLRAASSRLRACEKVLDELSSSIYEKTRNDATNSVLRIWNILKDDVDEIRRLQCRFRETVHLADKFQKLYPIAATVLRYRPSLQQVSFFDLNECQRKYIYMDHEGHYRIQGTSGSGKTIILLYRALRLAQENTHKIVRVWTINRALAEHLRNCSRRLTKSPPKNLRFEAFYDYCRNVVMSLSEPPNRFQLEDYHSRETTQRAWEQFYNHHGHCGNENVFAEPSVKQLMDYVKNWGGSITNVSRYLRDEVIYVQSAYTRLARGDYMHMERKSRSIPFKSWQREACLLIVDAWEEWLATGDLCDLESMTLEAARYIIDSDSLTAIKKEFPVDHALIDEVQDFSTLELSCIRALSKNSTGKNAICFFGDLNQKVYAKNHEYRRAGFRFTNRSGKLSQNYRNTKEILQAAMCLTKEYPPMEDETGGYEIIYPEFSSYNGSRPFVLPCTVENQAEQVVKLVIKIVADRPGNHIAVVSDNEGILERTQQEALKHGISHIRLRKNDDATRSGSSETIDGQLVISQLETIKGFEYDTVIVADISEGSYPRKNTPRKEWWRQAATLYAAVTRARDELIMTYVGSPSSFLKVMLPEMESLDDTNDYFNPKLFS